ncbi:uncharacterized protein LOC122380004 [Amphibalanus amphitrite]|uniref:uncharacterized protein LOC122380004 n=2 Tax=Amphibalanus amphitrite TaxID=1232801 RepID=UPI001C8FD829|nr:uncharacterized protein LOC122380004 [Amphibalanus amphitrite]
MLQTWLDRKGGTKMSRDTTQAAIYTCRGLVGLANYLLDKHSDVMKYVLLGKVQSDRIEGRFGYLRKLAGGNYWASVRQFLEGEAVVRVKSLVWLSGYSLGTVTAQMEEAQKLRQREDDAVIDMLVVAASCADYNGQLTEGTEQAIAHVAGYLARSVTKKHVCESCHELLVNRGQGPLKNMRLEEDSEPMDGSGPGLMDAVKTFTELLNRGGLLCPSELAVHVTTDMYLMYRWLVQDEETRYALFGCSKPRAAFQKVAAVISQEDTRLVELHCGNGHGFIPTLTKMAGALFNIFTTNYASETNSAIHASSGYTPSPSVTRSKGRDKVHKLTSAKKH